MIDTLGIESLVFGSFSRVSGMIFIIGFLIRRRSKDKVRINERIDVKIFV